MFYLASLPETSSDTKYSFTIDFSLGRFVTENSGTNSTQSAQSNNSAPPIAALLSEIGHDLRQPLQAMALFSSALEAHVADPRGHQILDGLKSALGNMESNFNDVLDLGRLDAGLLAAQKTGFQINDIFEELETNANLDEVHTGIIRFVPSSATLWADPMMVRRILSNLIRHTRRYAPDAKIIIGIKRLNGAIHIMMADNGATTGFDAKKRKVGLVMAHQLCQSLGSELVTKSPFLNNETGTCFRFAVTQGLDDLSGPMVDDLA